MRTYTDADFREMDNARLAGMLDAIRFTRTTLNTTEWAALREAATRLTQTALTEGTD